LKYNSYDATLMASDAVYCCLFACYYVGIASVIGIATSMTQVVTCVSGYLHGYSFDEDLV